MKWNEGVGKKRRKLFMTSGSLKVFACGTLFLYYFSQAVLQHGVLGLDQMTLGETRELLKADAGAMSLAGLASGLQLIGGLGLPVVAFLLAEGFSHTGSFRRYLLRMIAFAALSEIPYDLAMYGKVFAPEEQNLLFTLAVALVMLYGLRLFEGKSGFSCRLAQGAIVLAAVLWCMLLRSEFGFFLLLLSAAYYLLREQKGIRILVGCAMSVMYVTAPLSGYILWLYEGGKGREINKYIFYALYPLLLLVLFLLSLRLGG